MLLWIVKMAAYVGASVVRSVLDFCLFVHSIFILIKPENIQLSLHCLVNKNKLLELQCYFFIFRKINNARVISIKDKMNWTILEYLLKIVFSQIYNAFIFSKYITSRQKFETIQFTTKQKLSSMRSTCLARISLLFFCFSRIFFRRSSMAYKLVNCSWPYHSM